MLIIKCSDADNSYKKIKNFLIKGDQNNAEKLLSQLQQMNAVTLKDLQTEIQVKADLLDLIAALSDQVKKERRNIGNSKSIGKDKGSQESYELRKIVEEQ